MGCLQTSCPSCQVRLQTIYFVSFGRSGCTDSSQPVRLLRSVCPFYQSVPVHMVRCRLPDPLLWSFHRLSVPIYTRWHVLLQIVCSVGMVRSQTAVWSILLARLYIPFADGLFDLFCLSVFVWSVAVCLSCSYGLFADCLFGSFCRDVNKDRSQVCMQSVFPVRRLFVWFVLSR
jgi:hypothetical protein